MGAQKTAPVLGDLMSTSIPDSIVEKLLSELSSNDSFRQKFIEDAYSALAQLGYKVAKSDDAKCNVQSCLGVRTLASKEVIAGGHQELRRQLAGPWLPQFPFALEASLANGSKAA
jgi:putative modified peptide